MVLANCVLKCVLQVADSPCSYAGLTLHCSYAGMTLHCSYAGLTLHCSYAGLTLMLLRWTAHKLCSVGFSLSSACHTLGSMAQRKRHIAVAVLGTALNCNCSVHVRPGKSDHFLV
jgi:hypothetical protein